MAVLTAANGWLVDDDDDNQGETDRENNVSLAAVRRAALPTLLLSLQHALVQSGRAGDALALMSVAADEELQLMAAMGEAEVELLLQGARKAAIACVASGADGFGYPFQQIN